MCSPQILLPCCSGSLVSTSKDLVRYFSNANGHDEVGDVRGKKKNFVASSGERSFE